jgi:hypothetical protein
MTLEENFSNAFYHINSFKRHRALYNMERAKANADKEVLQYHELKMYQFLDNLELALRALQKEHRESGKVVENPKG